MKLSNVLYLLTSITIINAQDDNPSGHELDDYTSTSMSMSMSTSTSMSMSTSTTMSTTTSTFDSVSSGNENIVNIGLLCVVLML
jgi:hypothetical protein